jgi:hypothetical protein
MFGDRWRFGEALWPGDLALAKSFAPPFDPLAGMIASADRRPAPGNMAEKQK